MIKGNAVRQMVRSVLQCFLISEDPRGRDSFLQVALSAAFCYNEGILKTGACSSRLGLLYYGLLRRFLWIRMKRLFAGGPSDTVLSYVCCFHRTPLLRQLKDVDMWMQHNKIVNLKLASRRLDGVIVFVDNGGFPEKCLCHGREHGLCDGDTETQ